MSASAPGEQPRTPRRRALGFAVTGIATTLMLAGASAPSPFYPEYEERLHLGAIEITVAFGIYAVALLVALLTVGSISDHIGRRPTVSIAFVMLAVGLLIVWHSASGPMLYSGRVVQGLATGLAMPALSAAIADFAPPRTPRRANLVNTLAPMGGLALGAIGAGIMLQFVADAATATFLPLVVAYLVIAAGMWVLPETSPRRGGVLHALRPRAAVPAPARRLFGVSVPIILSGWATGGLFLSLGPTIVHSELHVDGQLGQALVVGLLPATGAVSAFVMQKRPAIVSSVYGASALAGGTLIMLIALLLGSLPVYVAAVLVAGTGFGTAFMGTIASLMPLAQPHERAELFASIYTVAYLSFGIPAVIAGMLVAGVGLHTTVLVFGAAVVLAAGTAAVLRARAGTVALD